MFQLNYDNAKDQYSLNFHPYAIEFDKLIK